MSLWSESVFLNRLFSLLFLVSAFMGMLVFANIMSRCHFYLLLSEFPSVPCGIRIPAYFIDRARHRYLDDVFENINKEDVFTDCSTKQIVLTGNSSNSGRGFGKLRRSLYHRFRVSVKARLCPGSKLSSRFVLAS